MCKITVFTPTYNRAYILGNLYISLCQQTFRDFEWLVIDDGSTDDTESLFVKWKEEAKFAIRYYKVKNGGKHRATNKGVARANGKYFFIVDSDDRLLNETLDKIDKWFAELEKDHLNYAGVSGNRGYTENEIIGTTFLGNCIDLLHTEREQNNITGDKAEAYYTSLLKKYPFPEFKGENFITERVVWDKMAEDGYKIRYHNEIIYLCNYLEDGLTKNGDKLFANNPKGTAYNLRQMLRIYHASLLKKWRSYNSYVELCGKNIGMKKAASYLEISGLELSVAVCAANIYRFFKYGLRRTKED